MFSKMKNHAERFRNYPTLGPVVTSVGLPNGGPGFVDGLNAVLK